VYLCTSKEEVFDVLQRGQGVFGIAVSKVLTDVQSDLVQLESEQADPMDELALRRAQRAAG
jgi:hypothetical protein